MPYKIQLVDTSPTGIKELASFLSSVFSNNKFTVDFLTWQYVNCPDGRVIGYNAYDDDKLIAHFGALPLFYTIKGHNYRGAVCLNVATDSAYRGQKLLKTLGEATISYARKQGFDFILAVPNANSTHTFLKYYDCELVAQLDAKVGFGQPAFDDDKKLSARVWTKELLDWRIKNPANKYGINNGYLNTPISFFAKTVSKLPMDASHVNLVPLKFRFLNLYIGLGASFEGKAYWNIPKFVKRPPFNLVFKDLTGNIPRITKDDMLIQLMDMDTI